VGRDDSRWGTTVPARISTIGNDGNGPTIRSTGEPRDLIVTHGADPALVRIGDIADGAGIVTQLEMIAASAPLYERLARGVKALVATFRSVAPDEQIHQCVRAVEALLPPEAWGAAAFVEHATRFVAATADRGAILNDFYQLRNAVEHLRGLDNRALPNVLPPDRPAVAMRRVRQAETLAIAVYRRVFTPGNGFLYQFRTEESIQRFWGQPTAAWRSIWGSEVDLSTVQ
jgi:hypothetical protein